MSLKTIPQIEEFAAQAGQYLNGNTDTKIAYALRKVLKNAESAAKHYNEDLEDLRIEHALTGDHGAILRDEKNGYKFDKAGLRALNTAAKKLHKDQVYEVNSHMVSDDIYELTEEQVSAFEGFILPLLS